MNRATEAFGEMRLQLCSLQKERLVLKGQVTDGTDKITELSNQLQATKTDFAKLKDQIAMDDSIKQRDEAFRQRDEALARASKAEDRVRELTLQLHRAGLLP